MCACEAVDQLGHPCRDQQARPGQLDNGAARGERERVASQRGDSGDVDLPRSGPLIDDLTMPVVLVCDRRVRGTRVLLAVMVALR